MNCPYCNKDTECGVIQSQHEIRWREARHIFITHKETDVTLSGRNIWKGSAARAYLCRECKKIIIDYSAECDLNKKQYNKSDEDNNKNT